MTTAIFRTVAAVLMVAALGACAASPEPVAAAALASALPGSRWQVVAIADVGGSLVDVSPAVAMDLAFDATGARVSGSAGCNRYSAALTIDADALGFGPAAASKRMCGDPPGVMALEAGFLAALARIDSARLDGDRLELLDRPDTTVMVLRRAAAE